MNGGTIRTARTRDAVETPGDGPVSETTVFRPVI